MEQERIVVASSLICFEHEMLGPTFRRAWPVEEAPRFSGLLEAIDEADRELWPAPQIAT